MKIAIGFTAGQIQIVDMATSDESKRSIAKINDERNHDNSVINSIQWLPGSSEILIAAFNSGDLFAFHRGTRKNDQTIIQSLSIFCRLPGCSDAGELEPQEGCFSSIHRIWLQEFKREGKSITKMELRKSCYFCDSIFARWRKIGNCE